MVKIYQIQKAVCSYFRENVEGYNDLKLADLLGPSRTRKICTPRHLAMYLARVVAKKSFPVIGREFGSIDHTSIMHAYRKIKRELKNGNPVFRFAIETITISYIEAKTSTENIKQDNISLSRFYRFSGK